MNEGTRVALHLLLPPLIGALLLFCGTLAMEQGQFAWAELPIWLLVCIGYGYVFAIVPSAFYALVMKHAYGRGLRPGSDRAILLSGIAGTSVGAIPVLVVLATKAGTEVTFLWRNLLPMLIWPTIGLITGLVVEWCVRILSGPEREDDVPKR